jgi:hypothetical protein
MRQRPPQQSATDSTTAVGRYDVDTPDNGLVLKLPRLLAVQAESADEAISGEGAEDGAILIGCETLGRLLERNVAFLLVP